METRASYVMVGLFVLLSFIAGLGYIAWVADHSNPDEMKRYRIYFNGNVMGLTPASQVYLNGVYVGKVDSIRLTPDAPDEVEVSVSLLESAPIREDSIATLEMRGVTGQYAILISGGTPQSPLLAKSAEKVPVIKSGPNKLQAVVTSLPGILAATRESLDRINTLLGQSNLQSIGNTLGSLERIMQRLSDGGTNISSFLDLLSRSSKDFGAITNDFRGFIKHDLTSAVRSFDKALRRIDTFFANANPLMEQASSEGIDEFRRALIDARQLMNTLNHVLTRLETDPRQFFFGNPVPEFPAR